MNLENLGAVAAIIESVATTLALVTGGIWAYYRFRRKREHLWNIDMNVTKEVSILDPDRVLVNFQVEITNIGTKVFIPGADGLRIAIRRARIPREGPLTGWDDSEPVMEEVDILERYRPEGVDGYDSGVYALDVGATYTERFQIVLERGHVYLVRTSLSEHGTDDFIDDYNCLDTLKAPDQTDS